MFFLDGLLQASQLYKNRWPCMDSVVQGFIYSHKSQKKVKAEIFTLKTKPKKPIVLNFHLHSLTYKVFNSNEMLTDREDNFYLTPKGACENHLMIF